MRVLITGASGFSAPFVAKELAGHGHTISLTAPNPCVVETEDGPITAQVCDLTDLPTTKALIADVRPDAIIHFASLAHVGQSWQDRKLLMNVNVNATSNLCQAVEDVGHRTTFVFRSSGQVYASSTPELPAQNEQALPAPLNPYGMSKMAAEYIIRGFKSEHFKPYVVRPFNLVGPGQSRAYVCSAFAHRILQTTDGGSVSVGNLDTYRDFCDVRDAAVAIRLILEKQPEEDLFVLGSGERTSIRQIFNHMVELSGKNITPTTDKALLRPHDPAAVVSDPSLAQKVLGWEAERPLQQSLEEIYQHALRLG
jgi:GDP-4-dehydro-6-deoxy-D-mannose reductase